MKTLFIADLHLAPDLPDITQLFLDFLKREQNTCQALYILGDLFESWIGDDDDSPLNQQVTSALRTFSASVPTYFMHGNRDFLIGEGFAKMTGVTLLPDPYLLELDGKTILLSHGDLLCTDDVNYQDFRTYVRNPKTQAKFLRKPLWLRRLIARFIRFKSHKHVTHTNPNIMDVNQNEVEKMMREANVRMLIHGHTHRPALHEFELDGELTRRVVLAAWHERGNVLISTPDGLFDLTYF